MDILENVSGEDKPVRLSTDAVSSNPWKYVRLARLQTPFEYPGSLSLQFSLAYLADNHSRWNEIGKLSNCITNFYSLVHLWTTIWQQW